MHPPFSFRSYRKENGPCTVQKKRRLERPNLHRKGASWGMRGRWGRCGGDLRASCRLRLTRRWVGVRPRIWRRGCKTEGGEGIAPAAALLPQPSLAESLVEGEVIASQCAHRRGNPFPQPSPRADAVRTRRGGLWPPAGDLPGRGSGTEVGPGKPGPYGRFSGNIRRAGRPRPAAVSRPGDSTAGGQRPPLRAFRRSGYHPPAASSVGAGLVRPTPPHSPQIAPP